MVMEFAMLVGNVSSRRAREVTTLGRDDNSNYAVSMA